MSFTTMGGSSSQRLLPSISPRKLGRAKADMAKGECNKQPEKTGLGDILAQPEGRKAEVDSIIFVHGLGGDRIETWTWRDKSEETFWPKDLLPIDCPTARILSFGYNADFAKFYPAAETIAPELTIDDYSTSLLEALKLLRGDTELVSLTLPSPDSKNLLALSTS
ncbi:hypothetical protein O1611_g6722 [Lasiodiplodia mahajangana]|uniref:Uncharacterized protein n=1 Tax=Lasiodiplodia mahajangana TaxID=1108764 RepID=A0ACC2JHK9_9PEZI|nr:hypothetical protein O1611_g6722 [Lasiodiplodia mahajangana]